jgi:hypothetical protein
MDARLKQIARSLRGTLAVQLSRAPGSSLHFGPPRNVSTAGDWFSRNSESGEFEILSPERISARKSADWADPLIQKRFEIMKEGKIKQRHFAKLKQGRTWGVGYGCCITPDDVILKDLSLTIDELDPKPGLAKHHEAQQRFRVPTPRRLSGTTIALHTFGQSNYHHWLLDTIPAFGLLIEAGVALRDADHVVMQSFGSPYHRETLARLGISESKIVLSGSRNHYICDELIVTSFSEPARQPELFDYTPEGLKFVRNLFLKGMNSPVRAARIIVSREKAQSRRLVNTGRIFERLIHAGFVKLCLEDFSVSEQAAVFAQAETIIMPTGGGLANMTFCEPGTKIIELFNPAYLPTFSLPLTSGLDLRYFALTGERTNDSSGHSDNGSCEDVILPEDRLFDAIDR